MTGVRGLRVIGSLLVLTVLLAGAGSLVASFFQQTEEVASTVSAADAITHIDIRTGAGDVTVLAAQRGAPLSVVRTLHWGLRRPLSRVTTGGGVATVTGECAGASALWLLGSHCAVDVRVSLPAGVSLQVEDAAGDVSVTGVDGPVRIDGGAGDLTLEGLRSTEVSVQTSAGEVAASFAIAPTSVRAHSSAGDVVVRLPADQSYRVTAVSSAGDRLVTVPTDTAAEHVIDALSSAGDVQVIASP